MRRLLTLPLSKLYPAYLCHDAVLLDRSLPKRATVSEVEGLKKCQTKTW